MVKTTIKANITNNRTKPKQNKKAKKRLRHHDNI